MAQEPLRHILSKRGHALAKWAMHVVEAAAVLIGIWLLEQLFDLLYRAHDTMLFDLVPLRYFFHALDAGVLVVFIYRVVQTTWHIFEE